MEFYRAYLTSHFSFKYRCIFLCSNLASRKTIISYAISKDVDIQRMHILVLSLIIAVTLLVEQLFHLRVVLLTVISLTSHTDEVGPLVRYVMQYIETQDKSIANNSQYIV